MTSLMVGFFLLLFTWLPASFSGVGTTERRMREFWRQNPDARATRIGKKIDRVCRIAFTSVGVLLVLIGALQAVA